MTSFSKASAGLRMHSCETSPGLLKDESLLGQFVVYSGVERIGIAPSDEPLIRENNHRGIKDDGFDMFVIRPQHREPEEVTYPSSWR
jgi:hypothetical protein